MQENVSVSGGSGETASTRDAGETASVTGGRDAASVPDAPPPGDVPDPVELVVGPRHRPLGGLTVNRVWPTARRRLVGPFIFFDHMLPAELEPGRGVDVPPHPHIGLATVTYLFEGEMLHRDSIGCEEIIRPGELNWMSAGSGIVHSERSTDAERARASRVHGIQSWVALPCEHELSSPSFVHYPADKLPVVERSGARLKLVAGSAFGASAGIETLSDLFYVEADLAAGATLTLGPELGERAAYIVAGSLQVEHAHYESGKLLVFRDGCGIEICARSDAKLMLFGGAPLEGPRHIWWNFVSSSAERIEAAKRDWKARRFPAVPGDDGYMPAPE